MQTDKTSRASLLRIPDGVTVISSQRYLDYTIVDAKRHDADYAVQVIEIDTANWGLLWIIRDGHHSLAAALEDNAPIEWEIGYDYDDLPIDDALRQWHNGSDYYNILTNCEFF